MVFVRLSFRSETLLSQTLPTHNVHNAVVPSPSARACRPHDLIVFRLPFRDLSSTRFAVVDYGLFLGRRPKCRKKKNRPARRLGRHNNVGRGPPTTVPKTGTRVGPVDLVFDNRPPVQTQTALFVDRPVGLAGKQL